ncbi:hypothetical protein FRB97_007265 [Tulasnella sp. 331]|nr:hypothetical protein FRB97_007265 [Tulasnella sp. 331]
MDRPLIVKCTFDHCPKRISFTSAANCTYELLHTKIEQSFSLSAISFTISYKDDDGEITVIANDFDLVEAVQYFQAGDDTPGSSNASVASYRSGAGRKTTLRVQVVVDYDGPSLSDTASLASRDDDFPHGQRQSWSLSQAEGSEGGFSLGGQELEDDAVTVSSKDHFVSSEPLVPATTAQRLPLPSNYRLPSHSVPSVATSPPSPPLSEEFIPLNSSAAGSSYQAPGRRNQLSPSSSQNLSGSSLTLRDAPTEPPPTAVFERLRLADQGGSGASSTGSTGPVPSSLTNQERGVKWLQEQNARTLHNILGAPAASSSSDASSISLTYDDLESHGTGQEATNNIRGDLALQRLPSGRFYYTYTSDSGSQQSGSRANARYSMSSDALASPIDRRISTSSQNLAWLANHQSKRNANRASSRVPGPSGGSSNARQNSAPPVPSKLGLRSSSSSSTSSSSPRPLPRLPEVMSSTDEIDLSTVPKELLPFLTPETLTPPELVTDCSSCGVILDTFRYVCSICGPKKAMSRSEYAEQHARRLQEHFDSLHEDPKGKGKALTFSEDSSSLKLQMPPSRMTYPPRSDSLPRAIPPPSPTSSWSLISGGSAISADHPSSPLSTLSSLFKSKPKGFRKMESRPSIRSSGTGDSSSDTGSLLSLPETAVTPSSPSGGGSPISPSSPRHFQNYHHAQSPVRSTTFDQGFELCSDCIYTAGVSHAYEGALDISQGHAHNHSGSQYGLSSSSETLINPSYHGCPVSPLNSPPEAEMTLRRSAPAQKGRNRHAFVESVWVGVDGGWKVIEQEDKRICSICEASLVMNRYKCVSCDQFDLCGGCYGQVHEIHPAHAFLSIPDKSASVRSSSPPPAENPTGQEEQCKSLRVPPLHFPVTKLPQLLFLALKHPDVSCYNCGMDIVGARFHCAVCKSVDICQNCESAGLPGNLTNTDGGHDSSHIMIKARIGSSS